MSGDPVSAPEDRLQRAVDAVAAVQELIGPAAERAADQDDRDGQAVEQLVDDTLHRLRGLLLESQPAEPAGQLAVLAFHLSEIRRELTAETLMRLLHGVGMVQTALARLRAVHSTDEMIARAPRILCECCDFKVAALMRLEDDHLVPAGAFHRNDPDFEAKLRATLTKHHPVRLDAAPLETEMLRRRTAAIVHDAYNDPRTVGDVLKLSGIRSYVAAPIMPEGRVIGFLHATKLSTVDVVDRDVLWTFAEGYGYALERTILVERLHEQGMRIRDLVHSTDTVLEQLREADLQIVARASTSDGPKTARATGFAAPRSPIFDILTRREVEIIELMAHGDTNRQIAQRIIVSEGTVKSHVRTILRKLQASNRAEAVSRYMRMLQHDG